MRLDEHKLREAAAIANAPTLLMVLVAPTGERRWLADPYRPSTGRGLDDDDTGGLPEQVQAPTRSLVTEEACCS